MNKAISFYTIVRKEIVRFMRIWSQTLLPPVITMVLYFIIFGKFIGSQINDINGFTYIQFIVPGLIMLSVITNSFSNVVSSFFGSKFQKSIEELLVSPTPNFVIIWGFVIGGVARGLIVGLFVSLTALFFTKIPVHNIFIVILLVLLTSIVFSLAGLLNGVFAKKFDDVGIVTTFVLQPLIYLGGVFYSVNLLPEFWRGVSLLNPILYMVNGFRFGFLGFSDVNLLVSIGMLLLFTLILFYACMHVLKKGVGLKS